MYLVNKNAQQIYDQTLYLWPCSILRFLVLVLSVLVPRACGLWGVVPPVHESRLEC